jgi:aminopeptidase
MIDGPFTPDELTRYAELAIGRCLDLRPGEVVLLNYQAEHRPLAIALAQAAFRRGLQVDQHVSDPLFDRAELDLAADAVLGALTPWRRARTLARTEGHAAALFIDGEAEPNALDGCDPQRVALRARRFAEQIPELFERIGANQDASLILAYPTAAWARRVYPDLAPGEAQRALAVDLLHFVRIGPEDGPGDEALARHLETLEERAATATRLGLRELHFRGPGTDLRVGLTQDAIWGHARATNAHGRTVVGNLPSEEIYTSPAASATEGNMRCTMPLNHRGRLYEDLRAEFRGGRLVRLDARTDGQRDELLGLLDGDEDGRRLGEVALVDASSRIGRRGLLYWNTLLDENQACHVALGQGFGWCRRDGDHSEDLNQSRTHIDVAIGSPELDVTGTTASGEAIPLIRDGTWRPS